MKDKKPYKVYILYLRVDEEMFDDLKNMLHDYRKYKEGEDGYYTGLYAWSNHMPVITEFIKDRKEAKDLFILRTRKFYDLDQYKEFRSFHISEKLDYYQYETTSVPVEKDGDHFVRMVTTKNEYICAVEDGEEYMYSLSPELTVDYKSFKNKIINSLDYIGYTTEYDANYLIEPDEESESEEFDRIEVARDSASYNQTVRGNIYKSMSNNKAMCLVRIFEPLFTGLPRRIKEHD